MKYIPIISLVLSFQCFGMNADYDYAPLTGREGQNKLDKLAAISTQADVATQNIQTFLNVCTKIDSLSTLSAADIQSVKKQLKDFDEILKIYRNNWRVVGDAEHSLFLNYKRAALLYCASYGLLEYTQALLEEGIDVFEKENTPPTCFDTLFRREPNQLLDSLINVARNRLSAINGHRTDIHLPYNSSVQGTISRYNQMCRETRLLTRCLEHTHQLKEEVEKQLPLFSNPLQLIVVRYAVDYKNEPVIATSCVIL